MYMESATETPQARQMRFLQSRHSQSALLLCNAQYIRKYTGPVQYDLQFKTRFN